MNGNESDGDLVHLAYVSTETAEMGSNDLVDLLHVARKRNSAAGLTGMLLHRDDSFFQILEGARSDVDCVFASIQKDPRHQRITVILNEAITQREFADWGMAFIELDGIGLDELEGFSDYLTNDNSGFAFLQESTAVEKLMMQFKTML